MIRLFDTLQNYEPSTKIRVHDEDTQEIMDGTVAQAFGWYDLEEFNNIFITQDIVIENNMLCVYVSNYGREQSLPYNNKQEEEEYYIKYLDLLKVTGQGVQVKLADTKHTGYFYKGELRNAPILHNDAEIDNLYVCTGEDVLTIILKGDDLLCQQIYMN